MKKILLMITAAASLTAAAQTVSGVDYEDGMFLLNEGAYGHVHGFMYFRSSDGTMVYRAPEVENGNSTQLGVTSQFGTVYGGKVYACAKQAAYSNEEYGARVTVLNASTLKIEKELKTLPGNVDARAIMLTDDAAYISTSGGILVYDPTLSDYRATIGDAEYSTMIYAGGKVFANEYMGNLAIINPADNSIESTIEGTFGTIVMSHDGNIWASVADANKLVKVNPYTLASEEVPVEAGVAINKYSWCTDGFVASCNENKLYWKSVDGWENQGIYCYDIDNGTQTKLIDMTGDGYTFYDGGVGVHPVTDNICSMMNQTSWGKKSAYREWNKAGELLADEELPTSIEVNGETFSTENPFPAQVFFADRYSPEFDVAALGSVAAGETATYRLTDIVSDADNQDAAIEVKAESTGSIDVSVAEGYLYVTGSGEGEGTLTLWANSNGRKAQTTIQYQTTGVADVETLPMEVNVQNGVIEVRSASAGMVQVCDAQGRIVAAAHVDAYRTHRVTEGLTAGVYVVRCNRHNVKVIVKY
ncbi:MAG: DUF5074 domain-containing protein [Muribaculaceae bacterium]